MLAATTASAQFDAPGRRYPIRREWSGQGLFPFDASNEAYKLGVNYMIYGLTH